jgi:hypothetical protein
MKTTSNRAERCSALRQQRGCLPAGFDENSWLSVRQFCVWKNRSARWLRKNRHRIAGLTGAHKNTQVHVGAHLRGTFPGLAKHFSATDKHG